MECIKQIEENKFLFNSKEKKIYELNLILSLLKIYIRANDVLNYGIFFKKYIEILNQICKKEQIFYINRFQILIYEVIKTSFYTLNYKSFKKDFHDHMLTIDKFYQKFHITRSKEVDNMIPDLKKMNYMFGDFFFFSALIFHELNLEIFIDLMNHADCIYFHQLGKHSQKRQETYNFISEELKKS